MSNKKYDTIIIGGGFYGLRIAQYLFEELNQKNILIIEKEDDVLQRASYNNQARVHSGYHYPRSVLTALRSRVNMPVFSDEYKEAIVNNFTKYYAVATNFSKVSANQFQRFFERIDAKIVKDKEAMKMFDSKLIEQVFEVEEFAFNSRTVKNILLKKLKKANVSIKLKETVRKIHSTDGVITVTSDLGEYDAEYVLNTTYSSINSVNKNSRLPIISLKHELTEMCLVKVPKLLQDKAITVMCGPFFSLMPFPDKGVYTLSHVRYTPHSEWTDDVTYTKDSHKYLDEIKKITHFPQMSADLKRYMPSLGKYVTYTGESIWEIKTVLPQSEGDDSRPILYKDNHGGVKNYICIMGGKVDNVYDVFKELDVSYEKK